MSLLSRSVYNHADTCFAISSLLLIYLRRVARCEVNRRQQPPGQSTVQCQEPFCPVGPQPWSHFATIAASEPPSVAAQLQDDHAYVAPPNERLIKTRKIAGVMTSLITTASAWACMSLRFVSRTLRHVSVAACTPRPQLSCQVVLVL